MANLNALKVVLSAIDVDYPQIHVEEIVKDRNLLKLAIKLAKRNGLYYKFICSLKEMKVELPPTEKERWIKEEKGLAEYKKTIELLNKVSNDYGIDYILIKECNAVPHIPRDVDIFIRKEDRTRLIQALENNGMTCVISDDAETILRQTEYIDIEFYTGINYFGINFIDEGFLLESRVKDKLFGTEYPRLNNESSFLLMLVHRLFGHRSLSLLDLLYLISLRKNIKDIDVCGGYAEQKGWGKVFNLALKELDDIYKKIYQENKVINFPYLFSTQFILKCITEIDGLKMGRYDRLFIQLSLVQDGILCRLNNTVLYKMLKSFNPARNAANAWFRFIKSKRGDKAVRTQGKN